MISNGWILPVILEAPDSIVQGGRRTRSFPPIAGSLRLQLSADAYRTLGVSDGGLMKPLVLLLAFLISMSLSNVSFAEDTRHEKEQHAIDVKAVRDLRKYLESEFLGGIGLTSEQNIG